MNNLTIQQAATDINLLIDQIKMTKAERDHYMNCLAKLFTTAQQTLEVVKDEKSA